MQFCKTAERFNRNLMQYLLMHFKSEHAQDDRQNVCDLKS